MRAIVMYCTDSTVRLLEHNFLLHYDTFLHTPRSELCVNERRGERDSYRIDFRRLLNILIISSVFWTGLAQAKHYLHCLVNLFMAPRPRVLSHGQQQVWSLGSIDAEYISPKTSWVGRS
jgi:hypothetical protein